MDPELEGSAGPNPSSSRAKLVSNQGGRSPSPAVHHGADGGPQTGLNEDELISAKATGWPQINVTFGEM